MPSSRRYDVIVAGLGAMGSSTVYQLARRGQRVLGFDRFDPPHAMGSTHGHSRIIRTAYWDDPSYVPLVGRAHESWRELEAASGERLYFPTGQLYLGAPDSMLVSGARDSVQLNGIPHEELSGAALAQRAPGLRASAGTVAIWEPHAGVLLPELAVATFLKLATRSGAEIHTEEPLAQWAAEGDGVSVTTPRGDYHADRLVLTLGAWTSKLVPDLGVPLKAERQVMHWFRPKPGSAGMGPERIGCFMWEYERGHIWYAVPDMGDGFKAGIHHDGVASDPDEVERRISARDIERVSTRVREMVPDANPTPVASAVCFYTDTPDGQFLIDTHPESPAVLVASPCSGHGFKFASVIGELLADLTITGHTAADLSLFKLARHRAAPPAGTR
jgi:sarcosine oxidase